MERPGGFQNDAFLAEAQFFRNQDSIGQIGVDLEATLARDAQEDLTL
ncbi:MAG TPA: hypothetical protein VLM37_06300 [Fibrobacteraceae bacterium]|nr:hypothetical protein [Fibrobacteraceae bacterium]